MATPTVLLLDGGSFISLSIARELTEDLDATVIGVGTTRYSRLLRSKYCDLQAIAPPTDHPRYIAALERLVEQYRPDVMLPVGYDSTRRVEDSREVFADSVELPLPSRSSFLTAIDKRATQSRGERVGLEGPTEYSGVVEEYASEGVRPVSPPELSFPVFMKPRWEVSDSHATTAVVTHPDEFWDTYDRIAGDAPSGDVLVQEYIDGSGSTFGGGVFAWENDVELAFSHEELRSVPRRGGSGTHLRVLRNRRLEDKAADLLREIGWHGLALVEFKRRRDGSYVLMEINPKFWSSYCCASVHGYRFASTLVARTLDLEVSFPIGTPQHRGELAFPLRELHYYATHREHEHLFESLETIAHPDRTWSIDWSDYRAWLTPPASVLDRLRGNVMEQDRMRAIQRPHVSAPTD